MDLYELHDHPPLTEPVMITALEGWIDAGMAGATAMSSILDATESSLIASFDTDALLDHRARRPVMSLDEGHIARLTWPSIELRATVDEEGRHVLLLVGAEPDHVWGRFASSIVELATTLDVRMVIGIGAYPAPVPHTRDTRLAITSPSVEVMESFTGFFRGTVDVPAGIQAAIEVGANEAGITSMGLWAQVPHYISAMPYPAGSLALLDGITRVSNVVFPTSRVAEEAATTRDRLNELITGNEQHESMVRQLEELVDSETPMDSGLGPLPTADELAAELQAFLRDVGDN